MRARRRLPGVLLVAGSGMLLAVTPLVVTGESAAKELPWLAGSAAFVVGAAVVWHRLRDHPVAWWFAVAGGLVAIIQALDGLVLRAAAAEAAQLPWALLGFHTGMAFGAIAIAHLIGLFPDGRPQRRYERRVLGGLWLLLILPPLVFIGSPTLVLPSYFMLPALPNPYAVAALAPLGSVAGIAVALLQGVFAVGVVLLVPRYRRASPVQRRQIRWLLLPALFAACVAIVDVVTWRMFPEGAPSGLAELTLSALWILAIASLPLALVVALLRPDLLDVDRVIRQSLVYGGLWALIAVAYVAAAAGLGLAAGRHLPLGLAIGLTVAATLVFHPARARLERLADEWVFGARTDPARLVSRLGAALEETVELERLLPRMAETVKEGLGLEWVRVRLEPAAPIAGDEPALTVPIVLDGERLGVVECGPRKSGTLTGEDEELVATLARQAALAVRNVRLTAELEASRLRLVRAQEAERRRIERNIHDGVQQDLVALAGAAAHVRTQLARDPADGAAALAELQAGLRRVISDLRELAHGIHPSLLSDRGLLEAVEALAARSTVPVSVRADPSLRGARFAEEIEGAGYFTIAEALANAGKHADASHVEVLLAYAERTLSITVHDDGSGFARGTSADRRGGTGLANLAERLTALGGRLEVTSAPGAGTTVTAWLRVSGG